MSQNEFIVILGKMGSGKSRIAKYLVKDKRRLIMFDPMRQFGDCGVVVHTWRDFFIYTGKARHGNFRVVYQPEIPPMSNEDVVKREFYKVCSFVDTWLTDLYLVIDEIDNCVSPRDQENNFFKNMLQRGRHSRISIVATTIRYTDTQRNLTAQASTIICFHTHEPSDIRYFRNYFGKMADELATLPPYHFIKYEKGQVSRHEPIKI